MAWDLQIDFKTGDLKWNSLRDLASAEGNGLIQQRMHVRLMIWRGGFMYDTTRTLGSRLYTLLDLGVPQSAASIEMVIREALADMDDITITSIVVNTYADGSGKVADPRQILATITYQLAFQDASTNAIDNAPVTSVFVLPTA